MMSLSNVLSKWDHFESEVKLAIITLVGKKKRHNLFLSGANWDAVALSIGYYTF